ncbi:MULTISPECIES: YtxH domain-containing protein [Parachlamydia]|uniref:General stress protein n=2 Tax=Parachlamydia acanthamoebae TaxID=83552 RepID=F8KUY5_PARAV|nr:YtxH domain-containing protein [Parachlamydia acanthamoebae]CCB85050.1 putative uncharacterized protein [Parachlamydia acanthamoebae UV-7]
MGTQNHVNCFLKGALLGGLTGSLAALLLAPKSGQELRNDLSDTIEDIREKSQHFSDQVKETGHKALHAFDYHNGYHEEEEDESPATMWLGGAFGAILGATSALLLAPQSGEKLREELGEKYDEIREKAESFMANVNHKGHDAMEYAEDWKDTLNTIISKLSTSNSKRKHASNSHLEEIIDWASLGIKVLQQFQNRR